MSAVSASSFQYFIDGSRFVVGIVNDSGHEPFTEFGEGLDGGGFLDESFGHVHNFGIHVFGFVGVDPPGIPPGALEHFWGERPGDRGCFVGGCEGEISSRTGYWFLPDDLGNFGLGVMAGDFADL